MEFGFKRTVRRLQKKRNELSNTAETADRGIATADNFLRT